MDYDDHRVLDFLNSFKQNFTFIKNIFYWFLRGGILYFYIKGHHQLTGKERVELFLSESAYGVT